MLSTKWDMDENRGKGHTINKSQSFSEIQLSGYPQKLEVIYSPARNIEQTLKFTNLDWRTVFCQNIQMKFLEDGKRMK